MPPYNFGGTGSISGAICAIRTPSSILDALQSAHKELRSNECEVMKVPTARHLARTAVRLNEGPPPSRCNDDEFFGAVSDLAEHVLASTLPPEGAGGRPSATFSPPQFRICGRDDEDRRRTSSSTGVGRPRSRVDHRLDFPMRSDRPGVRLHGVRTAVRKIVGTAQGQDGGCPSRAFAIWAASAASPTSRKRPLTREQMGANGIVDSCSRPICRASEL